MTRRVLAAALLFAGVSSCTLVLGQYDDSGTVTSTTSTSSTGGATTTSSTGGMGGATTTTTSTGGMGGATTTTTSTGVMCTNPATDCPATNTSCKTAACSAGMCTTMNAGAETMCSDHGGTVCDGNGSCVACVMPSDCPSQQTKCITNTCTGNACGTSHASKGTSCSDDGGKVCDGNGTCVGCNSTADCTGSDVCTGNQCVSPSCSDGMKDGTETDVDCGGSSCPPCALTKACLMATDCASGVCTAMTCVQCAKDADCASGKFCDITINGGTCVNQKVGGSLCTGPSQCTSGFCADGVCCNSACNSTCDACTNALTGGTDGVCSGAKVDTDPHNDCTNQGPATCGDNGFCDGFGHCALFQLGTVCANATCTPGSSGAPAQRVGLSDCDGHGVCMTPAPVSCSPYTQCVGTACATTCASDTDCITGYYCNGSSQCVPGLANGQPCPADVRQCASGFCADGVCCNNACAGTCSTCDAPTMVGTCSFVPSGQNNPMHPCSAPDICNGQGACVQCVGNGMCSAPTPFCDTGNDPQNGTCVQCNNTTDCPAPASMVCQMHRCLLVNGQPCVMNMQCASGMCKTGFCG